MMAKGRFAQGTIVSPEKTLNEVQALIKRYGATKFAYGEEENRVGVTFEMKNRRVRFVMSLPAKNEAVVRINQSSMTKYSEPAYQQAVRARWRALLLTIKSKVVSVESGIETFEEAFMGQIVLPNQQTVSEWLKPQLNAAYEGGKMPPMLLGGG